MLATGTTKALQGVARHIVAAGHGYFFNRVGHLLDRDVDEAFGHHLGAAARLLGQRCKLLVHGLCTQRFVGIRTEHFWKVTGLHFANHNVGVRHSQRAATAVTGRPGVGTRALRANAKTIAIECQQRATASRYGVNAHHRCTHAHSSHLGFKFTLELTRVMRHIGRGTAHVEANHFGHARDLRRARHAHNSARRPAQNRVFSLKGMRICQAP